MKPNKNYYLQTDRKRANLSPSPPPKDRKHFVPITEPKSIGKVNKQFYKTNNTISPFSMNKLCNQLQKQKQGFSKKLQSMKSQLQVQYRQKYQNILQSQKSQNDKQSLKERLEKETKQLQNKAERIEQQLIRLKTKQMQELRPIAAQDFKINNQKEIKQLYDNQMRLEQLIRMNQQIQNSTFNETILNEVKISNQNLQEEEQKLIKQLSLLKTEEIQIQFSIKELQKSIIPSTMNVQASSIPIHEQENSSLISNEAHTLSSYQSYSESSNDQNSDDFKFSAEVAHGEHIQTQNQSNVKNPKKMKPKKKKKNKTNFYGMF